VRARLLARPDAEWRVELFDPAQPAASVESLLERVGRVPLPPYIERDDDALDRERYQTVYAAVPGAVAAPTAGPALHARAARAASRPPASSARASPCTSARAPSCRSRRTIRASTSCTPSATC
jgi:hypothetical protein